ncbi:MAG: RrF2 family transcriptional regulator [Clostridia bacterium]|nr:RrF2 family transcriptional regulator [Clostridia bacterium]
MQFSTKGRYALRIMLDLALNAKEDYISLKQIASRQEISLKYLETIIAVLNKAGFVKSLRGKNGGYKLAGHPKEYTVGSILQLTEGSISPVTCLENNICSCERASQCLALPMWKELGNVMSIYLDSVTIEDLTKQPTN